MKKNIICIFLLIVNLLIIKAQSIDSVFVNMPDEQNPILSKRNRLELINSFKTNPIDSTINRFGTKSILLLHDSINKLIVVKNTTISNLEIKLVDVNGSEVICFIRTLSKPVANSSIEFYTKNWVKLPVKLTYPVSEDWLITEKIKETSIDVEWLKNTVNNNFVTISFSKGNNNLLIKNNLLDFLSSEERKVIEPFWKNKPILYQYENSFWNKTEN